MTRSLRSHTCLPDAFRLEHLWSDGRGHYLRWEIEVKSSNAPEKADYEVIPMKLSDKVTFSCFRLHYRTWSPESPYVAFLN